MKPIPAIVEPAPIDVDLIREQIIVEIADQRQAETSAARHDQQAANARAVAKERRLSIGLKLARVRGAWPARGPNAKGWSEFLASIGIAESTARMYIDEARDPAGFAEKRRSVSETAPDDDGQTGPRIIPAEREPTAAPFRALTESEIVQALARLDPDARKRVLKTGKTNVAGGSGDVERGTWCTSAKWAAAVGAFDLDPFSNPRSKIASVTRCMLEDGGDAFGGVAPGSTPGLHLVGGRAGGQPISGAADAETRVWIQPPYDIVLDAIAHYGHTRFCALLRFSPDVEWFRRLWPLTCAVAIPLERLDFDPPPGVPKPESSIPYPHALYYADERDITAEVRALCIIWRVDHEQRPPLHIVR